LNTVFLDFRPRFWRLLLSSFLAFWVLLFAMQSLQWQEVNDPAQLRYATFMVDHGMAPYRDLIEMNMPGIYLTNLAVVHTLGDGNLAWRLFDLLLMALAAAAMISIAWPYDWFAGVFSAALFILFHGHDGAMQTGQRDLILAVMMLCAYAFLFHAVRTRAALPMVGFGLAAGIAMTFKPTPFPFTILLIVLTAIHLHKKNQQSTNRAWLLPTALALLGLLVPLAVVIGFLLSKHAVASFVTVLRISLPYYATLGRRSYGGLLLEISPSVWWFTLLIVPIVLWGPTTKFWNSHLRVPGAEAEFADENRNGYPYKDPWESRIIVMGVLFGIASYLAQGKGLPYHRYPMVAFLFLWGSLQLGSAIRSQGAVRKLGLVGLAYGLVLAPLYVREADHNKWSTTYINNLTEDLRQLGGNDLNGKVQCLATEAECATTLYRMQLTQATGLFYDYFIFGPDNQQAIQLWRARFVQELNRNQPEVFIVHTGLYPSRDGYEKLVSWPLFANYLKDNYVPYADRRFPTTHSVDMAYRIYIRKDLEQKIGR
jgi:hypothetical protein